MHISNGKIITGYNNAFVHSEMSSYARLQSLNSDSKQTMGQINLKPTRVTLAGLEVFEEASTNYEFLVSAGAKSNKPQNRLYEYNICDKNEQHLSQDTCFDGFF